MPHGSSAPGPVSPRDAATVLLLREARAGRVEVFLVKRHDKSGFMAGAHVFPGGKVDAEDSSDAVLAHLAGRTPEQAVIALGETLAPRAAAGLFVAAVRETFEESGVLFADTREGADLGRARAALADGASFAEVLDALGARLKLDALVPWARWVTPEVEPRRFDARFFLATAPADQIAARDEREITDAAWVEPADAVRMARTGAVFLPPPTLRSLELVAALGSLDDVISAARARRPPEVRPVAKERAGKCLLVLPGDPDHPEPGPVIPGPTHFTLAFGRWWSGDAPERDPATGQGLAQ